MRALVTLVRRELWEHPALYVTPIVIGVLVLLSVLVGVVQGVGAGAGVQLMINGVSTWGDLSQGVGITLLLSVVAPLFFFGFLAVTFFYLLDALYAERHERTILFFKSLPVTDTTTVASKAVTGIIIAPALTVVALIVTQLLALLMIGIGSLAAGGNPLQALWQPVPLVQSWLLAAYAGLALALWYAPFAGWLLLASAWARRAVLLWGISPLLLGQVERLITGRSRLLEAMAAQATDFFRVAFDADQVQVLRQVEDADPDVMATMVTRLDLLGRADPASLLAAAQLWVDWW